MGCISLEIRVGDGPCFSHKFAVVDSEVMPFCVLLGANCLMDNGIVLCFAPMCCCQGDHVTKFSGSLNLLTTQPLVGMISASPGPFFCGMSNIHIGRPNNCLTFHVEEDDNEQVRLTHLVEYSELVTMQKI